MKMPALALICCVGVAALLRPPAAPREEIVLADFEGRDYGAWQTTGEAFGVGPAQGTLPNQMAVSGYLGRGLADSYLRGDGTTGTLTSPEFVIERDYLAFLIGGGYAPGVTCVNLLVDGKAVRSATGRNSERLEWAAWDVRDLAGRRARVEIVDRATGGWGHINVDQITETDAPKAQPEPPGRTAPLYDETYRPQFHFTPRRNWTNDPNGLVYYKGEYHLFFQHNPSGNQWGNMTWGHAVSRDLVHWEQLANAIEPDALGTIFSGSAVVDRDNTTGFQRGSEKPLVAMYTAAGGTSPESKGQPFTQCLAYSLDRGRTWTKYAGNPVLPHIAGENRDPKVVWYAPSRRWIVALYLDGDAYGLFASPDLKRWTQLQTLHMPGCSECPDFFQVAVEGRPGERRWVFTAANGRYLVGEFDGREFKPDDVNRGPLQVDYGGNYYAVQTYSDIPPSDGRRIQIAWMQGGVYPGMPFNQQMSFPCAMTLRPTPDGLRLYRWPVRELARLRGPARRVRDRALKPGVGVTVDAPGGLFDSEVEFDPGSAGAVGLRVAGEEARYDAKARTLTVLGHTAPLAPEGGRLRLRLLVDRTSIEAFANGGRVSLTSCFLPRAQGGGVSAFAEGGAARLVSLTVYPLRSAWPSAERPGETGRESRP